MNRCDDDQHVVCVLSLSMAVPALRAHRCEMLVKFEKHRGGENRFSMTKRRNTADMGLVARVLDHHPHEEALRRKRDHRLGER